MLLLQRGIATFGDGPCVFSATHIGEGVERTLQAFDASLDLMPAEGSVPLRVAGRLE